MRNRRAKIVLVVPIDPPRNLFLLPHGINELGASYIKDGKLYKHKMTQDNQLNILNNFYLRFQQSGSGVKIRPFLDSGSLGFDFTPKSFSERLYSDHVKIVEDE
jgi:hypothetical protein